MRFVGIIAISLAGCSTSWTVEDYVAIHESAATEIPIARQMEELFGPADHFITHFGMGSGTKTWNTVCYVNDRYEFTMKVQVEIDFGELKVTPVGEPTFDLNYVEEAATSGAMTSDPSQGLSIETSDWEVIYHAAGDFREAGFELETKPAPGIQHYIDAMRRPRIPIQLVDGDDAAPE